MSGVYKAGAAFSDFMKNQALTAAHVAVNPITQAVAPYVGEFLRGAVGAPPVAPRAAAVVAPVMAATPAGAQAHAAGQAMTAADIERLGNLSPAARAVLSNASPKTLAARDANVAKKEAAKTPLGAPTFDQMLQAYSGANGGKVSLRAMSALADIAAKTTAPHHVPSIADIAGQRALDLGDQLTNFKLEQAKAAGSKDAYAAAVQDQLDRYERIARARAIDPVTAAELGGN